MHSKGSDNLANKKVLQMQKKEYEKLAIQNLPKRLIKMQKKQVLYDVGKFFLFDLLGHPFMTSSLLHMFKGKSLFKMCLFLHHKCKLNFNSYSSDTKLEKLFNNPNLDRIRILKERPVDAEDAVSVVSCYSGAELSKSKTVQEGTSTLKRLSTSRLGGAEETGNRRESSRGSQTLASLRNLEQKSQESEYLETMGVYRDPSGLRLINKIKKEKNSLQTRIFFENEKLRKLLLKNDDISELKLAVSKMKSLREKIIKSQIRNLFKRVLWQPDLDICVHFSEEGNLFEVKDAFKCHDLNYVRFSFLREQELEQSNRSFMEMDDKAEESEYRREQTEDHVGEYKVLLIRDGNAPNLRFDDEPVPLPPGGRVWAVAFLQAAGPEGAQARVAQHAPEQLFRIQLPARPLQKIPRNPALSQSK